MPYRIKKRSIVSKILSALYLFHISTVTFDNLIKFTDELAYVPCFDALVPESDDNIITAALP